MSLVLLVHIISSYYCKNIKTVFMFKLEFYKSMINLDYGGSKLESLIDKIKESDLNSMLFLKYLTKNT